MGSTSIDLQRFLAENAGDWERLDELEARFRRAGARDFSPDELEAMAGLYRKTVSDLARARARFPGSSVTEDLNALTARTYGSLYGGRIDRPSDFSRFYLGGFQNALRRERGAIAFSLIFLFASALFGSFARDIDPLLPGAAVPAPLRRHFEGELDDRGRVDRDIEFSDRSLFSSYLMTHNIQVSFLCFAGGALCGAGSLYLLLYNGMMLGVLMRLFQEKGETLNYLAFIMPHGVIELTAIALSAAAGFRVGVSILNPGSLTRLESLKAGARRGLEIMAGVVPMLAVAGLIEGYFTPLQSVSDEAKLVSSGLIFAVLMACLTLPGRKSAGGEPNG